MTNGYTNESDNKLILKNLEEAEAIFKELFEKRLDEVAKLDAKRIEISKAISNDKEFYAKDPNLLLIGLIENTYRESKGNFLLFLRSLRMKRAWIERLQGELPQDVLKQLQRTEAEFGNRDTFRILIQLYLHIIQNADKDYIVGFMRTEPHPLELRSAISYIKNKTLANRIREAISALTKEELDYLVKYHREITLWRSKEVVTEDIPFFVLRTRIFIEGGERGYLGLFSIFKDEKLRQKLVSSPAFLRLMRHKEQAAFLMKLRNDVMSYKTDPKWEKFLKFYDDVEKIADELRNKFGNPEVDYGLLGAIYSHLGKKEIASELFENKSKFRQFPQKWLEYFNNLLWLVNSKENKRKHVIEPFINEMDRIFGDRIHELIVMTLPEISQLKDALTPLIKLEKNSFDKIMEETADSRKNARKRLQKLREKFDDASDRCIDALTDFAEAKYRIVNVEIMQEILLRLKNAKTYAQNEGQFGRHSLQVIGDDLEKAVSNPIKGLTLLYNFDKASRATINVSYNLRSIGNIFTRKEILAKLEELNRYMETTSRTYHKLEGLINTNLQFLFEPKSEEQSKGEEYGKSRAA
ncbi:hypothetical protein HYT53_01270 [Candidatus Woesearchaeota archaeon]|nr:hypothetical protein [Candidatus Woesearchaeota archaeon]